MEPHGHHLARPSRVAADEPRRRPCRVTVPIRLEDVVRLPAPGTSVPTAIAFSPDDGVITYLHDPDGGLVKRLYAVEPDDPEPRLVVSGPDLNEDDFSPEERLLRERQRQRALGVTSYRWAKRGRRIVLPLAGTVCVTDADEWALHEVVARSVPPPLAPDLSPDGRMLAFVRDGEVYVVDADGGDPLQVTRGARERGWTHGLAEFIAQEELGRHRGYWWSDDGSRIAFCRTDETHIPPYRIVHQGSDDPSFEDHRYPFAGHANAAVRLGVVTRDGGRPVWMDLGEDDDVYLARVRWLPGGSLTAQVLNRAQDRLELVRFDPDDGSRRVVLVEESDVWVNLHEVHEPLSDGGFVWASERTGFRHLELHDRDGALVRRMTDGDWLVTQLVRVDERARALWFVGTRESPLERHLYALTLDGGEPIRLTHEPGVHQVVADHGANLFVDTHSDTHAPPSVALRSLSDGGKLAVLHETTDARVAALGLEPPELVTFVNRDGVTLHGAVYTPAGASQHPLVVSVYGGPHAQRVTRSWSMTADMRAQYLRRAGFVVFVCDNRGSANRGLRFEGAIRWNLGDVEVRDQVDGVRHLAARGLTDAGQAGVYGWSYGGYMAAMCLARAPDVFGVAVAGAPVTHWDGYDTAYTERYMGTPRDNPAGYAASSVMSHVGDIRGRLMLVHGMLDENVHFRHTARLVNALNRAQKPYELLAFPEERHTPRREADRLFMERRIVEFMRGRALT